MCWQILTERLIMYIISLQQNVIMNSELHDWVELVEMNTFRPEKQFCERRRCICRFLSNQVLLKPGNVFFLSILFLP